MVATAARRAGVGGRAGSPLPTHQRRPGLAAAALALIFGLAALGAYQYQQAGEKSPLVVMVRPVAEGHVISRADVSTVAEAGPLTAIRGADLDSVVGQRAATRLLPNMLVQRAMLRSADALSKGQAQVGVAVGSGQIPSDGLDAGDTVQVLQLAGENARATADVPLPLILASAARVWSVRADPAQAGGSLVTLIVPENAGPLVAAASGLGRVALMKVPVG